MHSSRQRSRQYPPCGRPAHAFTLIEVLLTIAIVALLWAAGAGLYRWSRERAGISLSTSNIRQLVTANLNYAADNSGWFCPAQEPRNLKRWHGSRATSEDAFEPDGGFLTPYLGGDKRLETCPLLLEALEGKESFEDGAGGYGYNAAYLGGRPGDPYSATGLNDLVVPARTVMFATTGLSKAEGIQEYPFAEPYYAASEDGGRAWDLQPSVHFRAGGKAIVGWCDGHVSLEPPQSYGETNYYGGDNKKDKVGWFGPEDDNGFWNPHSPAVLNGWSPEEAESAKKGGARDEDGLDSADSHE
jgi:prepilin-type N-terminal cleavage/methylation domain-containing protein/prepilin-type processing-associated H-X9-DG protein